MTTYDEVRRMQEYSQKKFMKERARTPQQLKRKFRYQNRKQWMYDKEVLDPTRFHMASDVFNLNKLIRGVKTKVQLMKEHEEKKQGFKRPKRQEAYQDFEQPMYVGIPEGKKKRKVS